MGMDLMDYYIFIKNDSNGFIFIGMEICLIFYMYFNIKLSYIIVCIG